MKALGMSGRNESVDEGHGRASGDGDSEPSHSHDGARDSWVKDKKRGSRLSAGAFGFGKGGS
ncbi:hypothetical protein Tdes44962_MAKER06288 [Teratosphaeria destructans]|uniref:Uncharacterized protein n=1 Tax=Teratosphaeria destructans TaxID=418781 RepID=A0A9W7VXZ9_9PEZI|nr:hypothetical protein Tdes44962_MAKER06288 [Teratosphaeria destructans]